MPYLQVEGLKTYYIEKGRGPETILLVHGNVSSHEYWLRFLELLPDTYRCVALDLRGCGQTDHPSEGYNIPQFVEDLTLCERLFYEVPLIDREETRNEGVQIEVPPTAVGPNSKSSPITTMFLNNSRKLPAIVKL